MVNRKTVKKYSKRKTMRKKIRGGGDEDKENIPPPPPSNIPPPPPSNIIPPPPFNKGKSFRKPLFLKMETNNDNPNTNNNDINPTTDNNVKTITVENNKVRTFTTQSELGRGNFGITYKANDTESDQLYALKQLYKDKLSIPGSDITPEQIIETEINVLRNIAEKSDNKCYKYTLCVDTWGKDNDNYYIIYELLDNYHNLNNIIYKPIKYTDITSIANYKSIIINQLCEGLLFMQQYKIIHRDIKPDNIMVSFNNNNPLDTSNKINTKFIDFGEACMQQGNSNTICKQTAGTDGWTYPNTNNITDRFILDRYALLLVITYIIKGKKEWSNETFSNNNSWDYIQNNKSTIIEYINNPDHAINYSINILKTNENDMSDIIIENTQPIMLPIPPPRPPPERETTIMTPIPPPPGRGGSRRYRRKSRKTQKNMSTNKK